MMRSLAAATLTSPRFLEVLGLVVVVLPAVSTSSFVLNSHPQIPTSPTRSGIPIHVQGAAAAAATKISDARCPTSLFVKKSQGKGGSSSGSGFGSSSLETKSKNGMSVTSRKQQGNKRKDPNDDYFVFPRLGSDVQATLVKSHPVLFHESGALTDEVHDRLEHIYGFDNFNHHNNNDNNINNEAPQDSTQRQSSLQDLLMTDDESIFPSIGNKNKNSDLDNLIALATGDSRTQPLTNRDRSRSTTDATTMNLFPILRQLPAFTDFRVLHIDPLVVAIDDFFTNKECDRYIEMSSGGSSDSILKSRSPTVGKDASSRSQRTSTTWYHYYEKVPELMAKSTKLLGLSTIHRWEEPQTVRYQRTEKFTWHLDALGPGENRPDKSGQRTATLLVYLSDLTTEDGGATMFRDLQTPEGERLSVVPKKGSALLFFPAAGGIPNAPFDIRTLHCGQAVTPQAENDKWIAQLWLREQYYTPTAPTPNNRHTEALDAIAHYCNNYAV